MLRSTILLCMALAVSAGCDTSNEADTTELTDGTMPMTAPVDEPEPGPTASVTIEPTTGNTASGVLLLTQDDDDSVTVTGRLGGLPAGESLGFHVHEMADCSAPDASSAGEHFNPTGEPHGDPDSDRSHLGDMPNITANDQGVADTTFVKPDTRLRGDSTALQRPGGLALMVHADRDDQRTDPSGNSGERIACGVVQ